MIKVLNLNKSFKNKKTINDISLKIDQGIIFGLLGPNGAGKTTTIKLLTKQIIKDSGEIEIFGEKIENLDEKLKKKIGIMPEFLNIYEKLSAYDNLKYACDLYDVSNDKIDNLLNLFELPLEKTISCKNFSRGMKQKLLFARSIIHDPMLIFLDEPTSSLDPASREIIKKIIKNLKKEGKTIFLTTHYMEEAEELCDKVAIMMNGKIIVEDDTISLVKKFGEKVIEIEVETENKNVKDILKNRFTHGKFEVFKVNEKLEKIIISLDDSDISEKIKFIFENFKVFKLHSKEASLEEVFLKLTILTKYGYINESKT